MRTGKHMKKSMECFRHPHLHQYQLIKIYNGKSPVNYRALSILNMILYYTAKLSPHPQLRLAFGLLK